MAARQKIMDGHAVVSIEAEEPASEQRGEVDEIKKFTYRESKDGLMGRAEVAYGPPSEFKLMGRTVRGREILSFRLYGKKDGGQTSFNGLEQSDTPYRVIASSERLPNYACKWQERTVIVPEPRTGLDIALLWHELDHAGQPEDPKVSKLVPLYDLKSKSFDDEGRIGLTRQGVEETLEKLFEALPLMETQVEPDLQVRIARRRELRRLDAVRAAEEADLRDINNQRTRLLKEFAQNYGHEVFDRLFAAYASMKREPGTTIRLGTKEERLQHVQLCEQEGISLSGTMRQDALNNPRTLMRVLESLVSGEYSSLPWEVSGSGGQVDFSKNVILLHLGKTEKVTLRLQTPEHSTDVFLKTVKYLDEGYADLKRSIDQAGRRRMEILREAEKAPQMMTKRMLELFDIPRKLLERDATRKALMRADKAKEMADVDLYRSHLVPKKSRIAPSKESCAAGIRTDLKEDDLIETTIEIDLDNMLATYNAEGAELRDYEQ